MNSSIDNLIYDAVFSENENDKISAREEIRKIAAKQHIFPSSIYPFYHAIGVGKITPNFTVPAINLRTLTFDTACVVFNLMKKHNIGPVVFEIARSEIEYTMQQPDEYAVSILAAAIKSEFKGPVFLQGDHFQFSKNKYSQDSKAEADKIKDLVKESIDAGFYNIDIDASTLVDLEKEKLEEQQETNYKVTAELTKFIRSIEPKDITVSIGGEIGHIGGKNSTREELTAFMDGYTPLIESGKLGGLSKISVQTGTSHGGIPMENGKIADVKLDFNVLKNIGNIAREKYNLGGAVQHGASTLPHVLFDQFPKNNTLEIHLSTGFQNIVYDNLPQKIKETIYAWTTQNLKKEWESKQSHDQFIYKSRKKALGPFKKDLWTLSDEEKRPILDNLEREIEFLFDKLGVFNTRGLLTNYY